MENEERAKRLAAMKREKERQLRRRALAKKYGPIAAGGLCVLLIAGVVIGKSVSKDKKSVNNDTSVIVESAETSDNDNNIQEQLSYLQEADEMIEPEADEPEQVVQPISPGGIEFAPGYSAIYTDGVKELPEDDNKVASEFGILIDVQKGEVIAKKKSLELMYPASMTKVLTVLVAAENIPAEKLDDFYTVTIEATDYSFAHKCSNAGFLKDETVTVKDLFYGTILPSGGDAAYSLACYVAGSHEAFVELMNKKVEELGLSDTSHFTNCVGIYDKNHYTTAYDMAMIMKAAVENDFVRQVMTAHRYTTSITPEHGEGISLSNLFLRRIEDKLDSGEAVCAKTGFVNQSGCCAVSYFVSETNRPYICVTGNAFSSWRSIYDHEYIYENYTE